MNREPSIAPNPADCQAIAIFDIDGVLRDVGNSYRRALADSVERFTAGGYRPTMDDIDRLKAEGIWNNDWLGSQELVYRYFESQGRDRDTVDLNYGELVAFFQQRYRGPNPDDPDAWTGYICDEPLLVDRAYFESLSRDGVAWGFFSGATPASADFVLTRRIGLEDPVLVAMGDAPDKPDPTGLLAAIAEVERRQGLDPAAPLPAIYAGDTVADMQTVQRAKERAGDRRWLGIGILPPHVQDDRERAAAYAAGLEKAGADWVLSGVDRLGGGDIARWLAAPAS